MDTHPTPTRLRRVTLAGGLQLEYVEQGPRGGLPLVCLHGITDSWRSFEPLMAALPPDRHVIAISMRGHGGSDQWPRSYRLREFAADIAGFMQSLALPPALVMGHSMGSAVAMLLAAEHPQRVAGVVAAGAFASFADKADLLEFFRSTVAPLTDPVPHALAHEFQRSTVAGEVAPGLLETMTAESLRVPARIWRAAFAGLFEQDALGPRLPHVRAPTLLLWGSADALVPRSDTVRLLRTLSDVRLRELPGVGHAPHWEQPATVARAVQDFAASLESEGRRTVPSSPRRHAPAALPEAGRG